jgi:hypothetical protein
MIMDRGKEIELAANSIIDDLNGLEGFDRTDMINMFGSGVTWAEKHHTTDNNGCKFCKGELIKEWGCLGRSRKGRLKYGYKERVKPVDFGETCDLTIYGRTLHVDYDAYSCDSSFNDEIAINFCPMCGRKLNEVENISL